MERFASLSICAFLAACGGSTGEGVAVHSAEPSSPNEAGPASASAGAPTSAPAESEASPRDIAMLDAPGGAGDIFRPVAPGSGSSDSPLLYPTLVEIIKSAMPQRERGVALATQFVNGTTGYRAGMAFSSPEGFAFLPRVPGLKTVIMVSPEGNNFVFATPNLHVGHLDCSRGQATLGFAFSHNKLTDPDGAWTDNEGGACEIDVYAGQPGDFQGKISGRLVSNDKRSFYTLESAYFYARRAAPAGPPSARQWSH